VSKSSSCCGLTACPKYGSGDNGVINDFTQASGLSGSGRSCGMAEGFKLSLPLDSRRSVLFNFGPSMKLHL
jgi:hypothetical protein